MSMGERLYRPPDRSKYLLADEIAKLLATARQAGPTEHRFLEFMANTGVRPSESNQIRVADFNLNESRVRTRTLKQKKKKHKDKQTGEVVVEKKAKEIFRDVDLSPEYAKECAEWLPKDKDTKLFPYSRVWLWKIFKRIAELAKLTNSYTLYSLRHSRAIYLLEWTGDLNYVAKQLGHSSLDVTRVYLHILPSKREDIVRNKLKTF